MRLSQPFFQLPILFDVALLQADLAALPQEAWVSHPDRLTGNSAVRLISAGGGETDAVLGRMLPTCWLGTMPYLREILAGFGVVWSRSRLMRLGPKATVPEHADINYHWHRRIRLHIPIVTRPEVQFHCDGEMVHMAAGEAWVFDNWRRHHVVNGSDYDRVHLVADTSGTAAFWQFACGSKPPRDQWKMVGRDTSEGSELLTENNDRSVIMPATELEFLLADLCDELVCDQDLHDGPARCERFANLLTGFSQDWRQLCALYGTGGDGRDAFWRLAHALLDSARPMTGGLVMKTNQISAMLVLEQRVLQHLIAD